MKPRHLHLKDIVLLCLNLTQKVFQVFFLHFALFSRASTYGVINACKWKYNHHFSFKVVFKAHLCYSALLLNLSINAQKCLKNALLVKN